MRDHANTNGGMNGDCNYEQPVEQTPPEATLLLLGAYPKVYPMLVAQTGCHATKAALYDALHGRHHGRHLPHKRYWFSFPGRPPDLRKIQNPNSQKLPNAPQKQQLKTSSNCHADAISDWLAANGPQQ